MGLMAYIDSNYDVYCDVSDKRIVSPLFEVDEFIAPVISLLNKKGYTTAYCCSGHLRNVVSDQSKSNNDHCYIIFTGDNLPFVPEGAISEYERYGDRRRLTIRIYYQETRDIKIRMTEIFDTMIKLYEWAENLPERKSGGKSIMIKSI